MWTVPLLCCSILFIGGYLPVWILFPNQLCYNWAGTAPSISAAKGTSTIVERKWDYSQYRPYKGNTLSEKRRIYIHYYYNIDRAAEEEKVFDRKLIKLCQELETGQRILEPESTTKNTSRRKLHLNVVLW